MRRFWPLAKRYNQRALHTYAKKYYMVDSDCFLQLSRALLEVVVMSGKPEQNSVKPRWGIRDFTQ